MIRAAEPGDTSGDRRDGPVADVQTAFAVDLQLIGDEPPELGVEHNELHVAVSLAVARDAVCSRVAPVAGEAGALGANGARNNNDEEREDGRVPERVAYGRHGSSS